MSPITKRACIILSCTMLLWSFGCSDARKSLIDSDTGRHTTAQWSTPDNHGARAKAAPSATSGFVVCQECHREDYSGGISNVSCMNTAGCHGANVSSPHAAAPWRGATITHIDTNSGNAPVCARCHSNGANSSTQPSPPAAAGTAPGCFNSTLCHGSIHPAGWPNPDNHGAAAKSAPGSTTGFSRCQACHSTDFTGGSAQTTCLNTAGCHGAGVYSPHSPKPWRGGTRTHTNTSPNNASICSQCHSAGANSSTQPVTPAAAGTTPGCFNSTLCHGAVGHDAGWSDPAQHGVSAKSTDGFSGCEACHGTDFTGGSSTQSCLNTAGCHGAGVNSPHPPKPWKDSTYMHTSTDASNSPVCAQCHTHGLNSTSAPITFAPAGTAPGCFNNTLCHAQAGCYSCHTTTQNTRRVVTGPGGDFVKTDHHATNGTTTEIVTSASCIICHGDLIATLTHPSGVLPSAPNVQLMNPKTGAFVTSDATGVELVCSSCHDGTGATRLGSRALSPFSGDGDNTAPPNIGWTAAQQAHSVNGANGGCLACHGDTGTANAHGSSQSKMMKFTYNTTISAYPATNAANFCYTCHGAPVANGAVNDIRTQFAKTRKHTTAKCTDCHNVHQAKAGTNTAQTNTAGGVLNGATGAALTPNLASWAAPTSGSFTARTIVAGTDPEATLCFKCHSAYSASYNANSPSGTYAMTDVAREFNPNNVGNYAGTWASSETAGSFHPVLASAANNLGATSNISAPWTRSSLMTCSDCHASETTTDPNGPHGSAASFILKGPNTTWNATITSLANNAWMPAGTFCINCHANNDTNGRFPEHSRNDHSLPCSKCHVMIPHGSEHPGLLHSAAGQAAGVPVPTVVNSSPYMRATATDRLYIKSYPANNTTGWGRTNCGCNGTGH